MTDLRAPTPGRARRRSTSGAASSCRPRPVRQDRVTDTALPRAVGDRAPARVAARDHLHAQGRGGDARPHPRRAACVQRRIPRRALHANAATRAARARSRRAARLGPARAIRAGCASRPSTRSTWGSRAGCRCCRVSVPDLGIEEDARELYRLAAERLLEHLPPGDRRHSAAVATLLAHVDNRVGRFVELVIEMLVRREAWLPVLPDDVPATQSAKARLAQQLEWARQLVGSHLESLQRAFPRGLLREAAAVAARRLPQPAAEGADRRLAVWHGTTVCRATGSRRAALAGPGAVAAQADGRVRAAFDVSVGMPPGEVGQAAQGAGEACGRELGEHDELWRLLHAVRGLPPPVYDADEWRVLLAQLLVLRLAAAELELVFAERRAADYPRFAGRRCSRWAAGRAHRHGAGARRAAAPRARRRVPGHLRSPGAAAGGLTAGWQRDDGRTLFLVGDPDAVHLPLPRCGRRPVPRHTRSRPRRSRPGAADACRELPLDASP